MKNYKKVIIFNSLALLFLILPIISTFGNFDFEKYTKNLFTRLDFFIFILALLNTSYIVLQSAYNKFYKNKSFLLEFMIYLSINGILIDIHKQLIKEYWSWKLFFIDSVITFLMFYIPYKIIIFFWGDKLSKKNDLKSEE